MATSLNVRSAPISARSFFGIRCDEFGGGAPLLQVHHRMCERPSMLALGRPRAGGAFAARADTPCPPASALEFDLPATAIGKDYIESRVTGAPSGRGFQLSLRGLLSVAASSADSLELDFLSLNFGSACPASI
jgi:hypothetical protein